jgi:hypothetical protein
MKVLGASLLAWTAAFCLALSCAVPVSAASPASAADTGPARYTLDLESRDIVRFKSWRLRHGDNPDWARSETSDADWKVAADPGAFWVLHGLPDTGIAWYRARIRLESRSGSQAPLAMHVIHNPSAQEFYWDGFLVARNGRVGMTSTDEREGKIFQSVRLPPHLTGPGEHLLAVRVSNHLNATGGIGEVRLGAWKPLQNAFHGQWALLLFQVGIIAITGVYFFANFRARINRTYALFSLICLACVLQTLPRYFALYSDVDFLANRGYHALQYLGYMIMMGAMPLCFFSEFTSLGRKWYWAVGALTFVIVLPCEAYIFNMFPSSMLPIVKVTNDLLGFVSIGTSLAVTGWAAYNRKPTSHLASAGLLCMLAGVILGAAFELQFTWPLGLTALIVFLNAGLTRSLTRQGLAYQETHLKAARLEIELLKNNIQPHFLLTSLRSITDWLEKEPKMAARLVNALASELRMMLKMTSERVVSLGEEIALCRTHLEVMGLRRHRPLALDTRGTEGTEPLPPMVLHTLLEMGLEEAENGTSEIRFLLERLPGKGLFLRLSHGAPLRPRWQRDLDGTGLKYARARLQECFPDRWSLHVGSSDAAWSAEIQITDRAALAALRVAPSAPVSDKTAS